jgi:Protein of unknown function (DUF1566)/Domain of unknown function (DUF5018)
LLKVIFMSIRYRFNAVSLLLCMAIGLLTSCSSSSPDATVVAADFSINGVKGTISGQNVTIDLTAKESCSNLSSLIIGVQANGASISPDPRVARDYSQPVQFTITAPDGTKVIYTVTVKGNTCAPPPPVVPTVCGPEAIGSTGYSLVFKSCNANKVAVYYDKTECVRDNSTGLIWQGQTPAGTGLRANDQFKTNYDSTTVLQKGGVSGPLVPTSAPTQAEVDAATNTVGFKNAVNLTNLCGSNEWRIPTLDELLTITRISFDPPIDAEWFPNTARYNGYWTSTPNADYTVLAKYVGFNYGFVSDSFRGNETGNYFNTLVRLVR